MVYYIKLKCSLVSSKYLPLLFEDAEVIERLRDHPMALWKCK